MSIVVTGATGHLGRLIVEDLLDHGVPAEQIVATGRRIETLADLTERGVRVVGADMEAPESLRAAVAGADTVMLVSGTAFGRRAEQHGNVIAAAVAEGVRRVVYTSAPHADTSALVLAPEHKATEETLAASGLVTTILRNNWYTENYLGALDQARATGEITAAVGQGRVASATRADLAAGAGAVLRSSAHDGAVLELSGDTAWTHVELAAAAAEVFGRPVTYREVDDAERVAGLLAAGMDEGTAGFFLAVDRNIRDGALANATGDLAALLGHPTTSLVDGLRASAGSLIGH